MGIRQLRLRRDSVLETLNTQLRLGAIGSTSFIMHMAAALLFGGWWGGLGSRECQPSLASHSRGNRVVKIVFNVSQRILAVVVRFPCLHGTRRATASGLSDWRGDLSSDVFSATLGVFFVFAVAVFPGQLVRGKHCLSPSAPDEPSEKFGILNTRGVLVYDLGASIIAVLVAWLYTSVRALARLWLDRPDRRNSATHCCSACVWTVSSTSRTAVKNFFR